MYENTELPLDDPSRLVVNIMYSDGVHGVSETLKPPSLETLRSDIPFSKFMEFVDEIIV
jgi:hypothetical protein